MGCLDLCLDFSQAIFCPSADPEAVGTSPLLGAMAQIPRQWGASFDMTLYLKGPGTGLREGTILVGSPFGSIWWGRERRWLDWGAQPPLLLFGLLSSSQIFLVQSYP